MSANAARTEGPATPRTVMTYWSSMDQPEGAMRWSRAAKRVTFPHFFRVETHPSTAERVTFGPGNWTGGRAFMSSDMVIQDSRERATTDRLPIVRSKYGSPAVPQRAVARPRLSRALAGTEWRLALVIAGPASGKTVMVAQWYETLEGVAREWVTLDVGDDRPERFWLALAVGLERAVPGGFGGAVDLATDVRRSPRQFLDRLLMDMSFVEGPLVVVVDDVHFLRDPAIVEDLAWVVEHLPRNVQLVFTSRLDPPIPLARWRARSWLVEVRHRHLAFTVPETSQLFAALDEHRLGPGDIEELWRHTEGWAAGLRLAATAIRDRPDVSAAAREFSGSHRMVADLLVSEILDGQSAEMSDFLLSTSIADVLDADLCDALSGRHDSSVVLRGLEADMPFLVATSTDRASYRYHPLLAEMLRAELVTRRPAAPPALHAVAAAVLEGRGDVAGAVGHLLAAGDTDRAFSLAFTNAFERSDHADKTAAAAWVDLFPQELAGGSVSRMLTYALALGLLGRTDEGLAWLERAALRLADDPEPRAGDVGTLDALRLLAFTVSGAATDGPLPGRRALEAIDGGVDLGVVGARLRTNLARACLLVDQPDQAEEVLTGEPVGDEVARLLLVPAVAGRIALRRGLLGEADRQATRALAAASALGLEAHLGTLDAYLAQAGVLTERNQLGEATATFQRLDDIARRHPEAVVYHILVRVDQVRVANGRGGLDETFAMIDEMRHLMIGRSHPALEQIIDTVAARWRIEAGDINRAQQLISRPPKCQPGPGPPGRPTRPGLRATRRRHYPTGAHQLRDLARPAQLPTHPGPGRRRLRPPRHQEPRGERRATGGPGRIRQGLPRRRTGGDPAGPSGRGGITHASRHLPRGGARRSPPSPPSRPTGCAAQQA